MNFSKNFDNTQSQSKATPKAETQTNEQKAQEAALRAVKRQLHRHIDDLITKVIEANMDGFRDGSNNSFKFRLSQFLDLAQAHAYTDSKGRSIGMAPNSLLDMVSTPAIFNMFVDTLRNRLAHGDLGFPRNATRLERMDQESVKHFESVEKAKLAREHEFARREAARNKGERIKYRQISLPADLAEDREMGTIVDIVLTVGRPFSMRPVGNDKGQRQMSMFDMISPADRRKLGL